MYIWLNVITIQILLNKISRIFLLITKLGWVKEPHWISSLYNIGLQRGATTISILYLILTLSISGIQHNRNQHEHLESLC
jgi:hypothetical protein